MKSMDNGARRSPDSSGLASISLINADLQGNLAIQASFAELWSGERRRILGFLSGIPCRRKQGIGPPEPGKHSGITANVFGGAGNGAAAASRRGARWRISNGQRVNLAHGFVTKKQLDERAYGIDLLELRLSNYTVT